MATYRELMSKYLKQGLSFTEAVKRAKAEQVPAAVRGKNKRMRVDAKNKKAHAFYPSLENIGFDFDQARTKQDNRQTRVVGNISIKRGKIYYIDYTNGNVVEAAV